MPRSVREGTASSWKHIGMTISFAVGGFLGQRQTALPYLVAAGVCLLAAIVAACLREPSAARRPHVQRWTGYVPHMAHALRTALHGPRLATLDDLKTAIGQGTPKATTN